MYRIITLILATILCLGCSNDAAKDDRPNILLILVDDMGFSDLGCYGGEIHTPNIDALAHQGLRFTNFYNTGRCCPTRASLLTGLYPHQAGVGRMVYNNYGGAYQGYLNNQAVTLAEVLRTAGYKTMMSGKWHVGHQAGQWPTDRGFDRFYGIHIHVDSYYTLMMPKMFARCKSVLKLIRSRPSDRSANALSVKPPPIATTGTLARRIPVIRRPVYAAMILLRAAAWIRAIARDVRIVRTMSA